jgi:hypothetical protein
MAGIVHWYWLDIAKMLACNILGNNSQIVNRDF